MPHLNPGHWTHGSGSARLASGRPPGRHDIWSGGVRSQLKQQADKHRGHQPVALITHKPVTATRRDGPAGVVFAASARTAGRAFFLLSCGPSFPQGLGKCAVGLAAVADADDQDDELGVGDLVDNPVIADTEPVAVAVAGHFLDVGVWPSRVVSEW